MMSEKTQLTPQREKDKWSSQLLDVGAIENQDHNCSYA